MRLKDYFPNFTKYFTPQDIVYIGCRHLPHIVVLPTSPPVIRMLLRKNCVEILKIWSIMTPADRLDSVRTTKAGISSIVPGTV